MFCPNCGKEIQDGVVFCPSCGNKVLGTSSDAMKDKIKKATDFASNSAKSFGNKVNEATDGKAGQFAHTAQDKAKETVQNFSADVKQVVKDKDAKGFFKKNNYRNVKIVAGIIIVLILLGSVFGGKKGGGGLLGGGNAEIAQNYAVEHYSSTNVIDSVKFMKETDGKYYYMIRMTQKGASKSDGAALIVIENKEAKLVVHGKYLDVLGHYKDMIDR